jgi:LuxR family transcriptional regulator, maltose regulon positive regulatory protein
MTVLGEHPGAYTTPAGDPVLTAKLRLPVVAPWTVARQRLLDRMAQGGGGPLTIVVGPAGAGKTTLGGAWVAARPKGGPAVWVSLDAQDGRTGVLWTYLLAGLDQAGVPVGSVGLPDRPEAVETSTLTRLAAVLSEQPRPVTVVLDNAEVLTDPGTAESLDFLLRHADPQLRLILLGRTGPAFPLHRYRLAGSVVEIRPAELAFTVPEAQALFAAHHAELPESEVAAIVARTRGWAAGLRLTARSLQWGTDVDRSIEEYFAAEVLDAQPPGTRELMLRTSVVDRIWPGLAVALTGNRDAHRTLAALADSGTFVASSAADPDGYEYHPVVRDLLRANLFRDAPQRVPQLHRRASRWLAGAGRTAEAVCHATAAGDWEYATTLAVEDFVVGRLVADPGSGLAETFQGIPSDIPGPEAAVVQAAVALSRLDTELCGKHLLRATELVGSGPAERYGALRLAVSVTEAVYARMSGDVEATLLAVGAADEAVRDLGGAVPAELRTVLLLNKGRALLVTGDTEAATGTLTDALAAADAADVERLRADCAGQLAVLDALGGRLKHIDELGKRYGGGHAPAGSDWPAALDVARAWAAAEEYDLPAARRHVERAAGALADREDPIGAGMLAIVRTRMLRARGDVAGSAAVIARARVDAVAGRAPEWLLDRLMAVEATLRAGPVPLPREDDPHSVLAIAAAELAGGAVAAAAARLAALLARDGLAVDVRVEAGILTATCELATERTEAARTALARALRLAETQHLRRPVVEAPVRLRRFLRQESDLARQHAWLGAGVTGATEPAADGTHGKAPVVETLTVKETEVLRHLAALLSTEEIARKMFVSVNTVKTHIRGVLRKLAASRRNEAVRRAQDLGLVERPPGA